MVGSCSLNCCIVVSGGFAFMLRFRRAVDCHAQDLSKWYLACNLVKAHCQNHNRLLFTSSCIIQLLTQQLRQQEADDNSAADKWDLHAGLKTIRKSTMWHQHCETEFKDIKHSTVQTYNKIFKGCLQYCKKDFTKQWNQVAINTEELNKPGPYFYLSFDCILPRWKVHLLFLLAFCLQGALRSE